MDQRVKVTRNHFYLDAIRLLLVADARIELGRIQREQFEKAVRAPLQELLHRARMLHGTVEEHQQRFRGVRDLIGMITTPAQD